MNDGDNIRHLRPLATVTDTTEARLDRLYGYVAEATRQLAVLRRSRRSRRLNSLLRAAAARRTR